MMGKITGSNRTFLFLQGPHGPFFYRLGNMLRAAGADVWRVGFNAGDKAFWFDKKNFIPFQSTLSEWPTRFDVLVEEKNITDIVLYGDTRPVHAEAIKRAKSAGLKVHVFEEGYLRPYWVTYERDGTNGHSRLMNINVNEDLFNNLDRLAYSYARLGDNGQELVYGFKVKDADAMERTLRKLFAEHSPVVAQLGQFYHETDIQGHVIHILQFPNPSGDEDTMTFSEIGLTVVDRALVIGQGDLLVEYVQAAVHNPGVPEFYESRPFKEMLARVPADACSYGLSDLSAYARFFMKEVIKTAAEVETAMATQASTDEDYDEALAPLAEIFEGYDMDQLPSAEVIASYLGNSDGYSVIDASGLTSIMSVYYPERH